jgi:signal transduction histidine kinase
LAIKSTHIWLLVYLTFFIATRSFCIPTTKNAKNVLLLNSYHQGYPWTDSLTTGIISEIRKHPEITLNIEHLNSKQFGRTTFEITKQYISEKYANLRFDGVLVTDNDAFDFALKYDKYLFPNTPVVFAGISNPEDYQLENSEYYGITESANSDSIFFLIRRVLPQAKRILVLADHTTTGNIYRNEFKKVESKISNLQIEFPDIVDVDSICAWVTSKTTFDAIYNVGINQGDNGQPIDNELLTAKVGELAKVPLFSNDPRYYGKGVLGGLYQSGKKHGAEAAKLLVRRMNFPDDRSIIHVNNTPLDCFFDRGVMDRFGISSDLLPKGTFIFAHPNVINKRFLLALAVAVTFLVLIIVFLWRNARKAKMAEKKINQQYKKIHHQKKQLEKAYEQLSSVITELEKTNIHLNETNVNLLEAKKKAEESDNLKSAFLANVSHEIRTPLNSIVGFSSLLSESDLSQETRNSYIEMIESNTESLLVLIDEILDLSKIEAQQLTLKIQDFSMDELISELLQIFTHDNKNSLVELRVGQPIDGKMLTVFSDRVRVKQIFINLISNAFKFTDSGFIEMGYYLSDQNEVILYVKDTGVGIKKEHHQAIFNRFLKLNENSSRIYRGTGLGLAITQKLVELLGGKIWIESEPGKGSTFYFTLRDCVLKEL